jgi:hypothetical protein
VTLQGSCLCGAVRVELAGAPYRVGVCHCLDCRKKSGSLFSCWAIYPADAVTVLGETAGHELGDGYVRHICPVCTAPICEVDAASDELEVFVGVLDEPNQLVPTYETWTVRREAWLPPLPLARHYERGREGTGRTEP